MVIFFFFNLHTNNLVHKTYKYLNILEFGKIVYI